jgi:hypothetical protein
VKALGCGGSRGGCELCPARMQMGEDESISVWADLVDTRDTAECTQFRKIALGEGAQFQAPSTTHVLEWGLIWQAGTGARTELLTPVEREADGEEAQPVFQSTRPRRYQSQTPPSLRVAYIGEIRSKAHR